MFWNKNDRDFDELYENYKKKVFYTCYRYTRNNSDALEVSQEVFLTVYRQISSLRNKEGLSSWIYRITVNAALNFLKKNYRLKEISSDEIESEYDEKGYADVDMKDYFARVFERMSPMERSMIIMRDMDGLSYREIADLLDCKEGTVMSRLFNARKKFRIFSEAIEIAGGESGDGRK